MILPICYTHQSTSCSLKRLSVQFVLYFCITVYSSSEELLLPADYFYQILLFSYAHTFQNTKGTHSRSLQSQHLLQSTVQHTPLQSLKQTLVQIPTSTSSSVPFLSFSYQFKKWLFRQFHEMCVAHIQLLCTVQSQSHCQFSILYLKQACSRSICQHCM